MEKMTEQMEEDVARLTLVPRKRYTLKDRIEKWETGRKADGARHELPFPKIYDMMMEQEECEWDANGYLACIEVPYMTRIYAFGNRMYLAELLKMYINKRLTEEGSDYPPVNWVVICSGKIRIHFEGRRRERIDSYNL